MTFLPPTVKQLLAEIESNPFDDPEKVSREEWLDIYEDAEVMYVDANEALEQVLSSFGGFGVVEKLTDKERARIIPKIPVKADGSFDGDTWDGDLDDLVIKELDLFVVPFTGGRRARWKDLSDDDKDYHREKGVKR